MTNKISKVVKVLNEFDVVVNIGESDGVKLGNKFSLIGLGEVIKDPDTGEELGVLEIPKGSLEVIHLQEKISTMRSTLFTKTPDIREVVKTKNPQAHLIAMLGGSPETITERITPGESYRASLEDPKVGDIVKKL